MRAAVDAQAAEVVPGLPSPGVEVFSAGSIVKAHLTWLIWAEGATFVGLHGTDIGAASAASASLLENGSCGLKRGRGQNRSQAHARASLWSNQQAAFADPAKPGQMRCHLVGEKAFQRVWRRAAPCRNWKSPIALVLQQAGNAGGNGVQPVVHPFVGMVSKGMGYPPLFFPVRKRVDQRIHQTYANGKRKRIGRQVFAALPADKFASRRQICHADKISAQRSGQLRNLLTQ